MHNQCFINVVSETFYFFLADKIPLTTAFVKSITTQDPRQYSMISNDLTRRILQKVTSKNYKVGVVVDRAMLFPLRSMNTKQDQDYVIEQINNAPLGSTIDISGDLLKAYEMLSQNKNVENSTIVLFLAQTPTSKDLATIRSLKDLGILITPVILGRDVDVSGLKDLTDVVQIPHQDVDDNIAVEKIIEQSKGKTVKSIKYNVFWRSHLNTVLLYIIFRFLQIVFTVYYFYLFNYKNYNGLKYLSWNCC